MNSVPPKIPSALVAAPSITVPIVPRCWSVCPSACASLGNREDLTTEETPPSLLSTYTDRTEGSHSTIARKTLSPSILSGTADSSFSLRYANVQRLPSRLTQLVTHKADECTILVRIGSWEVGEVMLESKGAPFRQDLLSPLARQCA